MIKMVKNRKSYTTMYKKFVIKYYENMESKSKSKVAKVFNIARSSVREWLKEKDEIIKQKSSLSRRKISISSKTKKALYHDAEAYVYKWFIDQRENSIVMTTHGIQNKMHEIMKVLHPDDSIIFKASRGWLQNFMKRYNLSFRRITTTGRDLPKNCVQVVNEFLKEVKSKIDHNCE